ncbi:unnamed protein product [Gordionus sp. m RMFG-2023]
MKLLGMVAYVDLSMGRIVRALQRENLYNDTLIVFTSDNGGQVLQGGNNYPLRGNKGTLWEGGIRVAGFIHAKFLKLIKGYVRNKLIHAVDWYPTFVELAGGSAKSGHSISDPKKKSLKSDGVSQWKSIIDRNVPSPRNHFLINLMLQNKYFAGIRYKNFKLLLGNPGDMDGWYEPNTSNESKKKKNSLNESSRQISIKSTKKVICTYKKNTPELDKCRKKLLTNSPIIWYFNIKSNTL